MNLCVAMMTQNPGNKELLVPIKKLSDFDDEQTILGVE